MKVIELDIPKGKVECLTCGINGRLLDEIPLIENLLLLQSMLERIALDHERKNPSHSTKVTIPRSE